MLLQYTQDVSNCSQCYLHIGLQIVSQTAVVAGLEGVYNTEGACSTSSLQVLRQFLNLCLVLSTLDRCVKNILHIVGMQDLHLMASALFSYQPPGAKFLSKIFMILNFLFGVFRVKMTEMCTFRKYKHKFIANFKSTKTSSCLQNRI